MATYSLEQLQNRYTDMTAVLRCECIFATDIVGGLSASEEGIRAFVKHHLKIEDPEEAEKAVRRILKEEVGERDITPELGEIEEKQVYGVNVIRRRKHGPYLKDHMIKAGLKNAATRINLFKDNWGVKGGIAEAGRAMAIGVSLVEPDHPERIYLRDESGDGPAKTYFKEFSGNVSTGPKGKVSIIHHSECAIPGTRFAYELRFRPEKMTEDDLADLLAMSMVVGLGSVRSMENGKFRIVNCEIDIPKVKRGKKEPKKPRVIEPQKLEEVASRGA